MIDSVIHAAYEPIHDTLKVTHDSIIVEKKTIEIPIMRNLTGQESLGIGRIEFPKIYDSLIKHKSRVVILRGKDTIQK